MGVTRGWGDIGLSPSEVAVKEIAEESGYEAEAVRLLAVLDKNFMIIRRSRIMSINFLFCAGLRAGKRREAWRRSGQASLLRMSCLSCRRNGTPQSRSGPCSNS